METYSKEFLRSTSRRATKIALIDAFVVPLVIILTTWVLV